jgi:hypothetical protein
MLPPMCTCDQKDTKAGRFNRVQPCPCSQQISKKYTHYAAIALFFFFGARSLWEAYTSGAGVSWRHYHTACTDLFSEGRTVLLVSGTMAHQGNGARARVAGHLL